MARSHARLLTSIWGDKDFKALPGEEQRVYFMLLSQPDLGHSGLLSTTVRRWAGLSADGTKEAVWEAIEGLAAVDFLVVDEDTEEILIRTMVRNDQVWKQPKVLAVALAEAARISSPLLRARFAKEMERIDISSLPDKTKGDVEALLKDLPEALTKAHLEIVEERPHPPADPPPHPPVNAPAEGDTEGDRGTRARARLPQSPAPAPSTTVPPPAGADAPGVGLVLVAEIVTEAKTDQQTGQTKIAAKPRKTRKKPDRTPQDDQADELTNGFWELYQANQAQTWISIRQIVLTALKNGADRNHIAWALDLIGREHKPVTGPILTIALGVIKQARAQADSSGPPVAADRRQQATNDMFARALERARARDAQEAS